MPESWCRRQAERLKSSRNTATYSWQNLVTMLTISLPIAAIFGNQKAKLVILVKPVLRYDFEMYSVDNVPCASGLGSAKSLTSQGQARSNTVVAFFRDPHTTDVVTSAPPIVRLFLEEAGFELSDAELKKSEADAAQSDSDLRRALAAQLTAALSNRALKKALLRAADESEFDVAAFISAVVSKNAPQAAAQDAARPCTVIPRRPSQLRARGIKSRARPG